MLVSEKFNNLGAVILDWSGTTIDYGCMAPTKVFLEVFRLQGVEITLGEARTPMGKFKRDHIAEILQMPRVALCWHDVHGRPADEGDIDTMYQAYTPLQLETTVQHADLIPNVLETVETFRARGLKIGSCTGFTREMMQPLLPLVEKQGYKPDALVCPDDVGAGRPSPWMIYENMRRLEVYPPHSVVKIGDTVADVKEGLNAGVWTIALTITGNEVGLSWQEWQTLPKDEQQQKQLAAYGKLKQAGAHFVVDSLADTLLILNIIEQRLSAGERP
jgi:phosphonoacetaldehyde hydrolase